MANQKITFEEKMQLNLAENIQRLLGTTNLSITDFCNKIGVSREAFYDITNCASFPRPEFLYKIVKFFKIKVIDLFE